MAFGFLAGGVLLIGLGIVTLPEAGIDNARHFFAVGVVCCLVGAAQWVAG